MGVKTDSAGHEIIKDAGSFALNVLGKDQQSLAFEFFKPQAREGDRVGSAAFRPGTTGAPILDGTPAFVECRLVETVEKGDHPVFVGEVVDAGVAAPIAGRADDATLVLKDLGEKTFYGG